MSRHSPFVAILTLVAGVLVYLAFVPEAVLPAPAPPPNQTVVSPSGRADGRIPGIEARLAALSEEVQAVSDDQMDIADEVDTITTPAEPPTQAEAEDAFLGAQGRVIARFSEEAADPQWSAEATAQLRDQLHQDLPALQDVDVECRGSLCRLRWDSIADDEAARQAVGQIPFSVPWAMEGIYGPDPADPQRMLYFVSREGRSLGVNG